MMYYLFLFSISILPLMYSENVALPTQKVNSSSFESVDSSTLKGFSLHSEGGTLVASTSDLSQTKDAQLTRLLELDGELDKPKETPVKARKGVDTPSNNTVVKGTTELQSSTSTPNISHVKNGSPVTKITANVNVKNTNLTNLKPMVNITVPKKPLKLSYEALVSADKNIQDETKIMAANPPSTLPNSEKHQISSPNEATIMKVYPSKANSHPGMIMPIVITILVVPMFAIVGYLALKRGQEAWKNRHYKRMDFLLDGMYND